MNATATFSPAVEQLFDMFRKLPAADQERFRETLSSPETDKFPQEHLDILRERDELHAQGLDEDISAEQAFEEIYAALSEEQA